MSKKNRATDRTARAAAALETQRREERRRRNLMVGGVVAGILAVVLVVWLGVVRGLDTTSDVDAPSAGSEFGLTIGESDAPHDVVIYEDFHCVHCATLEEVTSEKLGELAADGEVRVEYRPVSFLTDYSARAANAFKVVLDESGPEVAQTFHDLLFEHYDEAAGDKDGLDNDKIVELAVEAGAEEDAVRPGIEDMAQKSWIEKATTAASDAGVTGTPTVLLDGAVFQEGRTTEEMGARLLNQLR